MSVRRSVMSRAGRGGVRGGVAIEDPSEDEDIGSMEASWDALDKLITSSSLSEMVTD